MFLGLRKQGKICCRHKMFLNKIRNIFCVPDTKFVSATNVARAGKWGKICIGNNVSSFASTFKINPCRKIIYLPLCLTQIVHSNGNILFFNQIIVNQSFFGALLTFVVVIFYFKEKFCVLARVIGKSLWDVFKVLRKHCRKKLYLRLYFTQIVHSYSKMLFLEPNNCASLTFCYF